MIPLNKPYVAPPKEEFKQFSLSRIEGLSMTEDEATLAIYRKAMEEGLLRLEEKRRGAPCN
jgi:hypothetical protein